MNFRREGEIEKVIKIRDMCLMAKDIDQFWANADGF